MARRVPGGLGRGPEALDHLPVLREIAVGEIDPGDVHAGPKHLLHHLPGPGRRANGADDLGFVRRQGHGGPLLGFFYF